MAKPPAGSSLLFGALADTGRIKERKNGTYRMVLKGIDDIDWFTDRPDRVAGEWSPKKLVKEWDVLFSDGDGAPNAQMSYTWTTFMDFVGAMKGRSNMSFEMFKPSVNKKGTKLSFEIKGIGKKNKERVAAQADRDVEDISLFIDDGSTSACDSLAEDLGIYFDQYWNAEFGPDSVAFANAKGTDYAFVSFYENGASASFTPSQQYQMVQSSLQYVADQATSDGNEAAALTVPYQNYSSDDLSSLLLSATAIYDEVFTGILPFNGLYEGNPLTASSYMVYSDIVNQNSFDDCFDSES